MPLTVGARVGSYEILAAIGAGGMGEVYRARDTRLNRDVAIKILPDLFANDPERLTRFTREAQALAALNHPNIAQIYGLEDTGDVRALVMEMIEGDDLSAHISRGPIPLVEVLPIARQIADALEAAHEQGIIHRDLKPANVKVRPDGAVKVLDFGLAKLADPDGLRSDVGQGPSAAMSPTLTARATQMGMIIGTAAYMAPEQARGKAVDKRADIWAFGVVLYEMLTGRRAFAGDEISDVLAAVLRQDIEWTALPADTPEPLRRLLRRCLEKDRRERLADMSAVRIEIKEALAGEPAVPVRDQANVARRRFEPVVIAGAVGLALLTGVAVWWLKPNPAVPPLRVVRSSEELPAGSNWTRTWRHVIAISPDGTRVAFIADSKLFVRELNQFELEAKPILSVADPMEVFFSSDGTWLGFFAAGQLQKVALTGGAPVPVGPIEPPLGATWSGDVIVFGQQKGLYRIAESGGTPQLIVAAKDGELLANPQLLPGGQKILFTQGAAGLPWDDAVIAVEDLSTHVRSVFVHGGTDGRYQAGYVMYGREGQILAIPFAVSTLKGDGTPVPLINGLMESAVGTTATGAVQFAVSAGGTLVYASGNRSNNRRLVWIDLNGAEVAVNQETGAYSQPRISPNGSSIAFINHTDVFVLDWARNVTRQLTRDPALDSLPVWTPGGDRIFHASARGGILNMYGRAADGSGQEERLMTSPNPQVPVSLSKDGLTLFYGEFDPKNQWDLYQVPIPVDGQKPRPLVATPADERWPVLSPDGRWLAYHSTDRGPSEVLVRSYPDVDRKLYKVATGAWPLWAPDGDAIYYRWDGKIFRVTVTTSPDFKPGLPQEIIRGVPEFGRTITYALSPDGKRFVVVKADDQPIAPGYRVVVNWLEELKATVGPRQ